MKRWSIALIVVIGLGVNACSGDDSSDKSADTTTTSTATTGLPDWLTGLGQQLPSDLRADGDLYVSDSAQIVYAQDCDAARAATSEGGKYGPKPRNEDGSGGANGYAFVCP